uniref:Uncharacterized protein n=1 Tax=Arundo donax TaxID=35708 RepID=A0A0A9AL33_ARUDO
MLQVSTIQYPGQHLLLNNPCDLLDDGIRQSLCIASHINKSFSCAINAISYIPLSLFT